MGRPRGILGESHGSGRCRMTAGRRWGRSWARPWPGGEGLGPLNTSFAGEAAGRGRCVRPVHGTRTRHTPKAQRHASGSRATLSALSFAVLARTPASACLLAHRGRPEDRLDMPERSPIAHLGDRGDGGIALGVESRFAKKWSGTG
jgi:hypothetical protein